MASLGGHSLVILLLGLPLLFALTHAATFQVINRCRYTIWAGASPGGGRRLNPGQSWTINAPPGTKMARIWPRTGCSFDGSGRGRCRTGDCGGVLECRGWGQPPNTLAEYALNQFGNMDFYDISVIDGFNVPMEFSPANKADLAGPPANVKCQRIRCTADIIGQCPAPLRAPGGCNNPCTVFKTDQYCCNSGHCGPTGYSKFFKARCPDAYSYPKDDPTSTFTCPGGTNYRVVFCPLGTPRLPFNSTASDLYFPSDPVDTSTSTTGDLDDGVSSE